MNEQQKADLERVWRDIWVQRFDHQNGVAGGPDNYYNGIVRAANTVKRIIRETEVST